MKAIRQYQRAPKRTATHNAILQGGRHEPQGVSTKTNKHLHIWNAGRDSIEIPTTIPNNFQNRGVPAAVFSRGGIWAGILVES